MNQGESLAAAQDQLRAKNADRHEDLTLLLAELSLAREHLEWAEVIGTKWGYPGNAALLVGAISDWMTHIREHAF